MFDGIIHIYCDSQREHKRGQNLKMCCA